MANRKILIIEDHPVNLELVQILLEKQGYEVFAAARAEPGIELAKAERPDLILMDMRLPGLSGLDAVKLLKQEPATQNIPVVVLTGDIMLQDRQVALNNGFSGYIAKPIDTREFATLVAGYLEAGAA